MTRAGIIRVVGEVMVDTVALTTAPVRSATDTPARIMDCDGGSAANLACWLAEAGAAVELIACVGDDPLGVRATDSLAGHGVRLRVRRLADLPTGRCLVIVGPDGERTMLPDPGANTGLRADDLGAEAWSADDHLHVSGYSLIRAGSREAALTALERAREVGITISIDASSSAPLQALPDSAIRHMCTSCDLVLANADEAAVLTGEPAPATAAAALAEGGPIAVVKAGTDGAYLAHGDRLLHVPAERVAVVDTTGAGDAFAAGFLAAWRSGADDEAALVAATRLASRAVGQPGGRP